MNVAAGPDWYELLGLSVTATTQELSAAVERLSRQATALSVTAPERSRLLRDQLRAIKADLLSGDAQRERYDQYRAARAARAVADGAQAKPAFYHPAPRTGPGFMARVAKFLQTGWTCTACGHGALPGDKFCQKCGSAIQTPALAQQPAPAQWAPHQPTSAPQPSVSTPQASVSAPQASVSAPQPSIPDRQQQAPSPQQPGSPEANAKGTAFCGKCGAQIAPGNTFCTQCGAQRG